MPYAGGALNRRGLLKYGRRVRSKVLAVFRVAACGRWSLPAAGRRATGRQGLPAARRDASVSWVALSSATCTSGLRSGPVRPALRACRRVRLSVRSETPEASRSSLRPRAASC